MNLDHYIEELKSLVNVDCGTQTIAGVAAVAGILESLWQREGWHTGQVNLGEKVGPGLFDPCGGRGHVAVVGQRPFDEGVERPRRV